MGPRRRFTPEFKRQAVQLLNAGQRPVAELARELGIPRNRLYTWQKDVAKHSGAFPGSGRQAKRNIRGRESLCGCQEDEKIVAF